MPDESPKRFDRIVAILIQLQSKKIVKAQVKKPVKKVIENVLKK